MTVTKIHGAKACVFDAYGTLFDVHSAVGRHRDALGDKADAVSATWRDKQLQYSWLRSLMGAYVPFWQVTREALEYAFAMHGVENDVLAEALMGAYLELDAYPEVKSTLETLQGQGFKLAILSNGSREMLSAAVNNAGLEPIFDAVLSVEAVGIFKPHASVYQMGCDSLGVTANEICFLSSNAWDVCGAANFGFQVAWINRFSQPAERLPGERKAMIKTLDELPPLIS
jgi:2-haloacid dehalogenase